MDYLATHPNAESTYYEGDTKLQVETDTANLVIPNARSRVVGHFYLSAYPTSNKIYPYQYNALILTECHTLKNVVSSIAEANCDGISHTCVVVIDIRSGLKGMG